MSRAYFRAVQAKRAELNARPIDHKVRESLAAIPGKIVNPEVIPYSQANLAAQRSSNIFVNPDDDTARAIGAMPSSYAPNTPEFRVHQVAERHGQQAAAWVFDGNTPEDTYRSTLRGLEAGDPEVLDRLAERLPVLADDWHPWPYYTTEDLMDEVGWTSHDGTDLRDALVDQYGLESSDAFYQEVERLAREHLGTDSEDADTDCEWDWNISSALYQVRHGELGPRTASARTYLLDIIDIAAWDISSLHVKTPYIEHIKDVLTIARCAVATIREGEDT